MDELAHWDCWGWSGNKHIARPEPNSKPERAMELLLQKARLVFGDGEDWSAWSWSAHEYGTEVQRVMRFTWRDGGMDAALDGTGGARA